MATKPGDLAEIWNAIVTRPTVSLDIVVAPAPVSRWSGYQAIGRGDLAVPTLAIGRRIVAVVAVVASPSTAKSCTRCPAELRPPCLATRSRV